MKKQVDDFLRYFEAESGVNVSYETLSPTKKVLRQENKSLLLNVVGINNGNNGLTVFRYGGVIIAFHLLYKSENSRSSAERIKNKVSDALPEMIIEIREAGVDGQEY